jgi:hypothetical protein
MIFGGCVENPRNPNAALTLRLRHQRRGSLSADWEDPDNYGPAQLRPNQEIRLDFDTAETLALHQRLVEWYALCRGGVSPGEHILSVVDENDVTILRGHEREILGRMLESGDTFWELLDAIDPDLFTTAALAKVHRQRVSAVNAFIQHMSAGDWDESDWQQFFENEKWIFGHGLAYQILDLVTAQPAYGGTGVNRSGLRLGDYLLATRATARFTVLVEIKRPDTPLLQGTYRGDVFRIGNDVSGGVAQVQDACRTWVIEGARAEANEEVLQGIDTFEPRGILVVGDTSELTTLPQKRSFELFRRNLSNPEIITFDELLARARYMVEEQPTPDD